MRRISQDDYKKLLPLKRIAEASSYSVGYVSILVQRKKLKAKKIGNKYYSTKEWFDQYMELHGREEKKLPPEVVSELINPLGQGGARTASQAMAQTNLKSQIDNLVRRAIKEKLEAPFTPPAEFLPLENLMPPSSLGWPADEEKKEIFKAVKSSRSPLKIPPKNLAEVLDDKIKPADEEALGFGKVEFLADLAEPETKLAGEWKNNLRQGENELKPAIKQNAEIIKTGAGEKAERAAAAADEQLNVFKISGNFLAERSSSLIYKIFAAGLAVFLVAAAVYEFAPQDFKFNSAGVLNLGSVEASLLNSARAVKSKLAGALKFNSAREFQYDSARALETRSIKAVAGIKIIAGQSSSGWRLALNETKHIADSILPSRYLEPVSQLKDKALALAGFPAQGWPASGFKNPAASDLSGKVAGEAELLNLPAGSLTETLTPLKPTATASAADLTVPSIAGPISATTRQMEILAMITGKQGKIADGAYDVRFALYNRSRSAADPYPSNADGNYKVWEEIQKVTIKNGALRTYLGLTKNLPLLTILASDQYYLGIRVADDSEMTPRKRLPAPLYAFNAMNAAQLDGRTVGNQAGNIPALNSQGKNIGRLDYSLMPVEVTDFLYQATGGAVSQTPAASSTTTLAANVINVSLGGTGLTSYQKGDMLYYDLGKTLARLAIGQEGQVLSMVNGLPVWSNVKNSTVFLGGGGGGSVTYTAGAGLTLSGTAFSLNSTLSTVTAISNLGSLSNASADLTLETTTSGNILLSPAGNVGIGSTSPLAKLTIQGTAGRPVLNIASSTGESLLYIGEAGNVGIGTTSPNQKLAVSGFGDFSQGICIGGSCISNWSEGGAIDTSGVVDGAIATWLDANTLTSSSSIGVMYGGTGLSAGGLKPGYLPFGAGASPFATSTDLFWDSANSRLGIGTTSPLVRFAIQGAAGANDLLNIASSTGASLLYINAAGQVGVGAMAMASAGDQSPKLQIAGAVAANYYCDANGNHCVDASDGWGFTGTFIGTTTVQTDGNFATSTLVGYQAANDMCIAEFAGSHFCRTDEIIYTIQAENIDNFGGTAWIAEGPPGYTANANDCNGWKSDSTTALGAFWLLEAAGGGAGWLTNCSNIKPISCCQ